MAKHYLIVSLMTASLLTSCTRAVKYCSVSWKNDDGTLINSAYYQPGEHPTHEDPKSALTPIEGHHNAFKCWVDEASGNELTPDYKLPNSDVTFKATYLDAINEHFVYWLNDDGELIDKDSVKYGEHPAHETPTSSKTPTEGHHFEFVNWKSQNGELYSEDFKMPDEDVIFTSQYVDKLNKYAISWVDQFGTDLGTTYVDYQEHPVHEDPKKDPDEEGQKEYFFDGWYVGEEKINLDEFVTASDTTIVAKYFTVNLGGCTYDLNADGESYRVTGPEEHYGSHDFVALNVYKGKPVTVIGGDAFRNAGDRISTFKIGDNVEKIEEYAFFCIPLSKVICSKDSHLRELDHHVFFGTAGLTEFCPPSAFETIGDYAFATSEISELDLSNLDHVASLGVQALWSLHGAPLHIYLKNAEMLEKYKNAWGSDLAQYMSVKTSSI